MNLSKSQTAKLGWSFTKNNLTQWGSQVMISILMSHLKVIKISQNIFTARVRSTTGR